MGLEEILISRGITRKEFLQACAATAAMLGLSESFAPKIAEAVSAAAKKPPVVWIKGQDCTGCTESAISDLNPSAEQLVLDILSFRFHPTIMAASGKQAVEAFEQAVAADGFLLVVEGALPTADDRFAQEAGEAIRAKVVKAASKAVAVIAVGACASFGGIPGAGPTKAKGVSHFVKDKPVINVPSCPVKPSRLVGVVMHYLLFKKLPDLDKHNRPLPYYGNLMHDNCPRRGRFEAGEFLEDWNDPKQSSWCLLNKGCKGPKTYTDCPSFWWNDGVNYCVNAGAPCAGCTQPEFYQEFAPLYSRAANMPLPGFNGVSADSVGQAMATVAAVGVAAHAIGKVVANKPGAGQGSKEVSGK